ncbi:hypothetical protein HYR54_08385 [Candidatus Acetothermia bacterium]|nr:hypothetical protein [Candidatus Acetothermia bacterium]
MKKWITVGVGVLVLLGLVAAVQQYGIGLDNGLKAQLNDFRKQLNDQYLQVSAQKKLLDEELNPGLERIYNANGTVHTSEGEQLLAKVWKLQGELANIEATTLKLAEEINDLQRKVIADTPGKPLEQSVKDAFNDLRRKVSLTITLIQDVYADDPDEFCPSCH